MAVRRGACKVGANDQLEAQAGVASSRPEEKTSRGTTPTGRLRSPRNVAEVPCDTAAIRNIDVARCVRSATRATPESTVPAASVRTRSTGAY
jgi:hypothetical protein